MITLAFSFVEEVADDYVPARFDVSFDTDDCDQAYELADRLLTVESFRFSRMIPGTLRITTA